MVYLVAILYTVSLDRYYSFVNVQEDLKTCEKRILVINNTSSQRNPKIAFCTKDKNFLRIDPK